MTGLNLEPGRHRNVDTGINVKRNLLWRCRLGQLDASRASTERISSLFQHFPTLGDQLPYGR